MTRDLSEVASSTSLMLLFNNKHKITHHIGFISVLKVHQHNKIPGCSNKYYMWRSIPIQQAHNQLADITTAMYHDRDIRNTIRRILYTP